MAEKEAGKEKEIGKIEHYYTNIGVAVVEITKGSIKAGDKLHIKGSTTDLSMTADSMQLEHKAVKEAKAGQSIGLKVPDHVRKDDRVYKA